ncbi:phosphatidate cytidylyltransferase [Rhizobium sp.]
MSRELQLRIVSAIVLAAVILIATWLGGVVFSLVAAAISLLIFHEWTSITGHQKIASRLTAFGWASVVVVAVETIFRGQNSGYFSSLVILIAFTLTAAVIGAIKGRGYWLAGGVFYAGLSGISLTALRGSGDAGLIGILFIFAIVWGTDILAYFVGRAIGGPKLAPAISPGKTWSGAIGGTVAGVIAGSAVVMISGFGLTYGHVVIAALLSIFSQIGDLFESFIKRKFGVKDSSHLIPGHGGVMDRVDGLVFACFLAFLGTLAFNAASGRLASASGEFISGK